MPGPLHGGAPGSSMPPCTSMGGPEASASVHSGAARPCGHQFTQRMRTIAADFGVIVTVGHPGGGGCASACHAAGASPKCTPWIGFRWGSSRVIAGRPVSVHAVSEKSETVSSPTRDPAAPWSIPTARSWPAVQGFAVLVALPPEPPVGEGGVVEPAWPVPVDPPVVVVVAGPPLVDPHAVSAAAATSAASAA